MTRLQGVLNRIDMKFLHVFLFSLILCGCVSNVAPKSVQSSWTGHNIQKLIDSWGYPTKTIQMPNGNSVHLYSRSAGSDVMPLNETVLSSVSLSCDTWFEVDDVGTIIKWQYSGNGCRSTW